MKNKSCHAFTLLEIMVVMFLLGLMATMIVPRLQRRPPSSQWKNILSDINNMVLFARQEAIANQQMFRLKFKAPRTVVIETEKPDPEEPEKKIYGQEFSYYFTTQLGLAKSIIINGVYLGRTETMGENKGEGYCYVISNGLVQDVSVFLTRSEEGDVSKMTMKMMPFKGVFQLLEGHVRPEG